MVIEEKSLPEPILDMIALGEPTSFGKWSDYATIGITTEHAPQLLELMTMIEYHHSYDQIEIWIPLHAWRALAQLHELSMQRPFAQLLLELEDDQCGRRSR